MSMSSSARATSAELVELGLATAATIPGTGCAVLVEETSTVNLRWALSGLTTNGLTVARSVTVIVGAPVTGGTGVGVLNRQGVDAAGLVELVTDAAALAARATPAEDANPFVEGGAFRPAGAGPGWDDPAAQTGTAALAGVAEALGEVFGRSAGQQRESFGFALHEMTTSWLGTSGGLRYRHDQPRGTIELTGKAGARSRSAWIGQGTRDFSDVDVLALDDEIATRLRWQERTVERPPGRYDTVLPPSAVADFLIYYLWSSDARSAYEGRSVFSKQPGSGSGSGSGASGETRIGEALTEVPLTLFSDPHRPGLECSDRVLTTSSSPMASVFDNGLPSPAANWLQEGRINALPTTRHTAGLTGLPVVPIADNLILEAGTGAGSTLDLVAGMDNGLLLTCLWYIREVDPQTLLLTGLTRDGVYVVEGGEVIGATTNFRFNESPVDLLSRVQAAGASEITLPREWGEWFTRASMPALRIEGYNMSTASEAS
jgi:predicted Zn-dependent protease